MQIKLTKEHFEELIRKGLSLDHVFLLMLIKEGHNMELLSSEAGSMKFDALHQSLIRKGLITEDSKIAPIGQELLDFMESKVASPIVRKKPSTKDFDLWWEAFPATDHFEYKGRIFTGSRAMRVQKEQCKLRFNSILNEGEYTAQQIIDATKYVVTLKKENSFKKKTNEVTYIHNSYKFLNDGDWKPFVDLMKQGVPFTDSPVGGGTDI